MPETRSKKREKDDPKVEEVKEEPKGKRKKTKEKEEQAEVSKKKEKKVTKEESSEEAEEKPGPSNAETESKVAKISIEACNSWPRFKKMAKEYLEHFASFFPDAKSEINPDKPRRGAFNIRWVSVWGCGSDIKNISFSITLDSGDTVEVWDGRTKGPPRKEKFPDKDTIVDKIKKLSS